MPLIEQLYGSTAGVAQQHEIEGANDALKWAARTYLVSAIAAITYSHTMYLCFLKRD